MNLREIPWLPSSSGLHSLDDLLTHPERVTELTSGRALTDLALLRLLVLLRARGLERLPRDLDLYGDRPFMQAPRSLTDPLPDTPIHALDLTLASGRDVTLLSRTFDKRPQPLSPAAAAQLLITFQALTPSRGLTKFNPGKDTPGARSVHFHTHGATLTDTLTLNTPPGLDLEGPFPWEHTPDWQDWRGAAPHDLTPGRAHAYPWRSVTLRPDADGTVRWAAQASGPVPTVNPEVPWPDPHTHGEIIPEKDWGKRGRYDRVRNPQSREVMGSLARTLHAALSGDPLAPASFRAALTRGARRARATALITRSGQPVVLNVAQADLPWPTIPTADATAALAFVTEHAAQLPRTLLSAAPGTDARTVREGPPLSVYWQRLWPTLSLTLTGHATLHDLQSATYDAAQTAATGLQIGAGHRLISFWINTAHDAALTGHSAPRPT